MRRSSFRKSFFRTVRDSFGRFLAIALIIALGAAMFVGLRTTTDAMLETAQEYVDRTNFFDFRLLSTYGFEQADVETLAQTRGISAAEGGISMDVLVSIGSSEDIVWKMISLPESINTVELVSGRMPESPDECLADAYYGVSPGTVVTISAGNKEGTLENFNVRELTVVGIARTPIYMNFNRGSTALGTGRLSAYAYVLPEAFAMDVWTEVYLCMEQSGPIYSDAYAAAADAEEPFVTAAAEAVAAARKLRIQDSAYAELADAEKQYEDGLQEYLDAKADAEEQLQAAAEELENGRQELADGEAKLAESEQALQDAQEQVESGSKKLTAGQAELNRLKRETYAQLDAAEAELNEQEAQVRDGLAQVNDGIAQAEAGLVQIEDGLAQIEAAEEQIEQYLPLAVVALPVAETAVERAEDALRLAEAALILNPDNEQLRENRDSCQQIYDAAVAAERLLRSKIEEMEAARDMLPGQKQELLETKRELEELLPTLYETKAELEDGARRIDEGRQQLADARAEAEAQFAKAQAQLDAGKRTIDISIGQITEGLTELESGREQLEDAREQLEQGERDYEAARMEAETEFADAEAELNDAAEQLESGREAIEALEEPEVYVLDRSTNIGYSCFEGDAQIVKNISAVFPIFFFLIAALVCMTTIDKMVDEERSQIGTLKALGYSDARIRIKYLAYSGTASFAGVTAGSAIGTAVFPAVLWNAYSIMYSMPEKLLLYVDWPLCIGVVLSYMVLIFTVTRLSCGMACKEVPAELIRPKSPPAGKRLLMERLFFWNYLPFLHKVTLRNIFRYKKRLFMTLIGVSGCTALLVTGWGLRDSIMDLAELQYGRYQIFEASVNFSVGLPEANREVFRDACRRNDAEAAFAYQTSVDVTNGRLTKSTSLVVPADNLTGFWNLSFNGKSVPMPGMNAVLVSRGLADQLSLETGDTVTVTTPEMEILELTVGGIFNNNVYTYMIVSEETVKAQWNAVPDAQVAYLNIPEEKDAYAVSADLMKEDYVVNISVTEDTIRWAKNTMSSMYAIIWLIVGMAAGLAFIVLYNLTNINISERIREVATINVLGFRKRETESYLFRESVILCLMGGVAGLFLGKLLHSFVMSQIKIDMISFDVLVSPVSYLISVAMTMLFGVLVNFVLSFRLQKINMAEALKSIE